MAPINGQGTCHILYHLVKAFYLVSHKISGLFIDHQVFQILAQVIRMNTHDPAICVGIFIGQTSPISQFGINTRHDAAHRGENLCMIRSPG